MSTLREVVSNIRACVRDQVRAVIERDDAIVLLGYLESQGLLSRAALSGLAITKDRTIHPRFLKAKEMTESQARGLEGVEQDELQRHYAQWLETEPGIVIELQDAEAKRAAAEGAKKRGDVFDEKAAADAQSISAAQVELAKNPRHVSLAEPSALTGMVDASPDQDDPETMVIDEPARLGSGPKTKAEIAAKKKLDAEKAAVARSASSKLGEGRGGGTMKASDMIKDDYVGIDLPPQELPPAVIAELKAKVPVKPKPKLKVTTKAVKKVSKKKR